MIARVWRRCSRVRGAARVLVATDDGRIAAAVRAAGGEAVMTGEHASGTDRIAAARARRVLRPRRERPGRRAVPRTRSPIEALIASFGEARGAGGGDARDAGARRRRSLPAVGRQGARRPGRVRGLLLAAPDPLARRTSGRSRPRGGAVPRSRPTRRGTCGTSARTPSARRSCRSFTALAPTPGERAERLEQLRILEHGRRIRVVVVGEAGPAVDTPEDLAEARRRAAREAQG